MITIRPFKGLRPTKELVASVAAKPYDVLNSEEARIEVASNNYSFLRISKPEVNFPMGQDLYAEEVYQKGKEVFDQFRKDGIFIQDATPCFYIYRQIFRGRTQTGLVVGSSIDDYFNDRIKKHELTLTAKENDRIKHMSTKMAQPGMVFLAYRKVDAIDTIINQYTSNEAPEYSFGDDMGVEHIVWVINDAVLIEQLSALFKAHVPASYIADGHHRAAASAKVGQQLRTAKGNYTGEESYNYFLSCLFPSEQLQIMDYNRLVKDLNGHGVDDLLTHVKVNFDVQLQEALYKPESLHEFSMYLDQKWYRLTAKAHAYNDQDPIDGLDVTVLSKYVLDPLLGIKDQRTDKRIDFVGGIRGLEELQKRVDSGEMAVAFALYPVTLDQLMNIADTGNIMPPKSTWFEPKLKSGLIINLL